MPDDERSQPERPVGAASSPEDRDRPAGENRALSARDLQENASEGDLDVEPGSDADQAAEVPHVG